jgi:hypothetical protein
MWTRALLVIGLAAGIAAGLAVAQQAEVEVETPPTTVPDVSTKATRHETVATGRLPELGGRWLVLSDLDLGGRNRTVASFWEVGNEGGAPEIVERFVSLPADMHQALEGKNEAAIKWEPTDEELARIAAAWDELPDQKRGVAAVKNELWGKDAFTDEIKAEEKMKDANWVIRQAYEFVPGGNRPVRQVNIFGVSGANARGFEGVYSGVAVAVAPFPIPIPYNGGFRMVRLDPAPATGLLARIAAMFSGCGR